MYTKGIRTFHAVSFLMAVSKKLTINMMKERERERERKKKYKENNLKISELFI
jgi:hypothetical protein